jgi:CRP-like cAMP-binding protein
VETRHSSTIVARTTVRALRIMRDEIQAQMAEDAALADHFVQRITARLSTVLDTLRSIDTMIAGSVPVPPHAAATKTIQSAALH